MVSRRGRAGLAALALVLACAARAARAQDVRVTDKDRSTSVSLGDSSFKTGDGLPLGPVHLHPFLREQAEFDDNIFLESRDRTAAFLFESTLGLRADLFPANHEISAGYRARGIARIYHLEPSLAAAEQAEYDARIESLDRVEQVADARGALAFPWGRFEVNGIWERLNDPLNFAYTRHIRRDVMGAGASASVETMRIRVEASGSIRRTDFAGAFDYLDNLQASAAIEGGVAVAKKFHVLLGYGYTRLFYDALDAYDESLYGKHAGTETHFATLGVRGPLSSKLEILVRGGVAVQCVLEGLGTGPEPVFFALVRGKWTATEKVSFELSYGRDFQISQLSSYQTVDRGEAVATWAASYFVSSKLYVQVENTAPSEGDSFLRWCAGVLVDYRMTSWLATGVGAEWRARVTEIPGGAFRNFRAWIHVSLIF